MTWWQILKEVWSYGFEARKWWMLVLVTLLVGIGWLLAFSESSLVAPFLYPLF
ncbi:MAG: DUF5989 family protein [Acidobacteriota bacterium]|jgi:hypothetical protein